MYSFSYLEPVCCSMSSSNCCFLTCIQISQEACQVVWYSHLFQNFPQFIVIHTVKGIGIVSSVQFSRSVVSDSLRPHGLQPTRLLRPWDFPGKSTGVGCHCLLWKAAYMQTKKQNSNSVNSSQNFLMMTMSQILYAVLGPL